MKDPHTYYKVYALGYKVWQHNTLEEASNHADRMHERTGNIHSVHKVTDNFEGCVYVSKCLLPTPEEHNELMQRGNDYV